MRSLALSGGPGRALAVRACVPVGRTAWPHTAWTSEEREHGAGRGDRVPGMRARHPEGRCVWLICLISDSGLKILPLVTVTCWRQSTRPDFYDVNPSATQPAPTPGPRLDAPVAAGLRTTRLVALALGCALLALVPALWLLSAQQRDLAIHEERLRGHERLVAAMPLVAALPWHRDLSTRLLLGETAVEGALRRGANEVRSALRRVDAMFEQRGDSFALGDDWREVGQRWAHLESRYARLAAAENVEAHNRLLQHVEAFLAQLAQRSQLPQEPAAATHLLILCETDELPALSRHVGMLRAHGLLAGREPSPDRRQRVARTLHDARAALDRLAARLSAAYAVDAATRALLDQRSARALALVQGVLQEADALLGAGHPPEPDAGAWFSTITQAVESLQGVNDALSERVATLLAGEVETLRVRRRATQALAVLFGSCALLAALVLGRALLARGRGRVAGPLVPPSLGMPEDSAPEPKRTSA